MLRVHQVARNEALLARYSTPSPKRVEKKCFSSRSKHNSSLARSLSSSSSSDFNDVALDTRCSSFGAVDTRAGDHAAVVSCGRRSRSGTRGLGEARLFDAKFQRGINSIDLFSFFLDFIYRVIINHLYIITSTKMLFKLNSMHI